MLGWRKARDPTQRAGNCFPSDRLTRDRGGITEFRQLALRPDVVESGSV
ncbi:MAG: hypothetical protein AAFY20_06345 [Cyanobacteria bacterium J06639_14]